MEVEKGITVIGKDGYKSLEISKDPELKNLFGVYGQVSRTVLKNKDISHGAKFFFVVLRAFVRWDKSKPFPGKTVMADTFLTSTTLLKNGYDSNINVSRQTVGIWRRELEKHKIVSTKLSPSGWIYTFNVLPENDFEQITRFFILSDKLTLSEKEFIINVIPYVFLDNDVIGLTNTEISKLTGYSYNAVKANMEALEEKAVIRNLRTRREFNLSYIMTGLMDNYVEALQRIQALEKEVETRDKTIETRDKTIAQKDKEIEKLRHETNLYKLQLKESFSEKEIKMIEDGKVVVLQLDEEQPENDLMQKHREAQRKKLDEMYDKFDSYYS